MAADGRQASRPSASMRLPPSLSHLLVVRRSKQVPVPIGQAPALPPVSLCDADEVRLPDVQDMLSRGVVKKVLKAMRLDGDVVAADEHFFTVLLDSGMVSGQECSHVHSCSAFSARS